MSGLVATATCGLETQAYGLVIVVVGVSALGLTLWLFLADTIVGKDDDQ